MIHWLNTELWAPMWPNMFAPSVITIGAVIISHIKARKGHEKRHQEIMGHIKKP